MSTYAVERIKQITDCMLSESVAPLVKYTDNIETVLTLFDDLQSRQAFQRELVYLGLLPLLGAERSHDFANNFSDKIWADAVAHLTEMQKNGAVPEIKTVYAQDSAENVYLNTVNFSLQQYIYKNIVINENDVVLDVGAGYGHSAFWAESKNASQVFAFEPHPVLYNLLEQNVASLQKSNIYPQCILLAAEKGAVQYQIENQKKRKNVKPAEAKTIQVEVNTLDSWCSDNFCKPNFIKITSDNPVAVLAGAKETLAQRKPNLAAGIGNKLNYMWEVPLVLKNIMPEYKLFCRKNAPYGEFILYAQV